MKKRWTALLLALTLALSLTACGGEKQPVEEDAQEGVEDTLEDTQSQPETDGDEVGTDEDAAGTDEDMTAVDIEDIEQEQAKEPQIGQRPADTNEKPQSGTGPADLNEKPQGQTVTKPTTEQKPATEQKPSTEQKPESTASVDLSAFAAGLAESQSDWPGMMAMEGETLEAYYPGLSALSLKQCVVQMAMISASGVEIALVEVSSSADVETVKGIFQARIDYQVGDGESPGGAWYPEPTEMWKSNSRIVSNGNYVMLVAYGDADAVVDSFNALFA